MGCDNTIRATQGWYMATTTDIKSHACKCSECMLDQRMIRIAKYKTIQGSSKLEYAKEWMNYKQMMRHTLQTASPMIPSI